MTPKKKKGKAKQAVPATAGPRTSPGGTPRPGLQVADKPDIEDTDVFDASRGKSLTKEPSPGNGPSPGGEESQPWEEAPEDPHANTVSPRWDIDEEEFRNVWGSGDQSGRQKHL